MGRWRCNATSSKCISYIREIHKLGDTVDGVSLNVLTDLQNEIKSLFKNRIGWKKRETNLFFTVIDKMKEKVLEME